MNKGLRLLKPDGYLMFQQKNSAVVHPQSIIHSMVEWVDHSIIAQLGMPDMKVPISYAFTYPDRIPNNLPEIDFFELKQLTFEKPDLNTFTCLHMAYEALKSGGSYPVVLNAANEVLVQQFLDSRISFIEIQNTIKKILDQHKGIYNLELEEILEIV